MKSLHKITFILLVIGGLNWLLVGVIKWDVGMLFGGMTEIIPRIIYTLVGLSALVEIFSHKDNCKNCEVKPMNNSSQGGMQM